MSAYTCLFYANGAVHKTTLTTLREVRHIVNEMTSDYEWLIIKTPDESDDIVQIELRNGLRTVWLNHEWTRAIGKASRLWTRKDSLWTAQEFLTRQWVKENAGRGKHRVWPPCPILWEASADGTSATSRPVRQWCSNGWLA